MKILEKTFRIILGILLVGCLLLVSPLFIPYLLIKAYYYLKTAYLNYKVSLAKKRAAKSAPAPTE